MTDISGEAGKFNPDIEANNNVDVGIIDVIVEPNFPGIVHFLQIVHIAWMSDYLDIIGSL